MMFNRYGFGELRYPDPEISHWLVAVDLGKRKVGVAVGWVGGDHEPLLTYAATVTENSGPRAMARKVLADIGLVGLQEIAPVLFVCEWPMKYGDRRKYHDAITELHKVGDSLDLLCGGWDEKYRPGEWKGNAPKTAHHKRIRAALRPEELEVMPANKEHDAWDAAGIWLFATNRTGRGGTT